MRHFYIFILSLFLSLFSSISWGNDFKDCTKQEIDNIWLKFDKTFNDDKSRYCLALKTVSYLEDVFEKDISPLTPEENEWVTREYEYFHSNGNNQTRKNEFLNHKLRIKYDLFNDIQYAKVNLIKVAHAIAFLDKQDEIRAWATTVSHLLSKNIYSDYRELVDRGIVPFNQKAGLWNSLILPDLLNKGIVFNVY